MRTESERALMLYGNLLPLPDDVEAILNGLVDEFVFVDEIPMDPFRLTELIDGDDCDD